MLGDIDVSAYPFRLVSRRLKHVLNSTGTELPGLARKGTTNPAYMHPDDVAELDMVGGDLVEITLAVGQPDRCRRARRRRQARCDLDGALVGWQVAHRREGA